MVRALGAVVLRLLSAALLALVAAVSLSAAPPAKKPTGPPHLLIPTSADLLVCAPYEHGRSCKTAWEVQRFILGNARDDCGP
jgi:hypothetical protein